MFPPRILALLFLFAILVAAVGCGGGGTSVGAQNSAQPATQQKAPSITFAAQPATVSSGTSTVLSWNASNATSVSISGVGAVAASGSQSVTPTSTTNYTLTATGPGGTSKSSTVVTVNGSGTTSGQNAAPTVTFSVQPGNVAAGASAVLSWTTSNASSVSIAGVGVFAANGSTSVTPTASTTYTATVQGAGGSVEASASVTVALAATTAEFGHVFLVMEENHSYSSVIGSSSLPYLNSLAKGYGLATEYFGNTHPSIGNYFELTTGQIITNNDAFSGTVSVDNVVRHLISAGKTWKSYAENLPSVGYKGGDVYPYAKHHNPFAYLTDVVNSTNQVRNLVPFTEFASDLANHVLPQYSYIVPNMLDDAHDGTLSQADNWLKSHIAPLIASSTFQQNGLLVIVFDESLDSDTQHGGGHVAAVVVSPMAKRGYRSTTLYQHQSVCRLLLQGLGLSSFPGSCGGAGQMAEFF
ncbi:MAG TPA: alkaline phosphatase family protein [Candidatus Acidoferrum sp.]|nr:alkaline phosphatase family protein [Candidatus Acidoferrum sp.]